MEGLRFGRDPSAALFGRAVLFAIFKLGYLIINEVILRLGVAWSEYVYS